MSAANVDCKSLAAGVAELPAQDFLRRATAILSPLRYPGAKRRLASYISESITLNRLKPSVLVEPFAGSASVTLQLLTEEVVRKAALGEKDPLVASFWRVVFNDPDWLISRVKSIDVSLSNWDRFRNGEFPTDRYRALACLFLNRTSFSGIISKNAGPIGGRAQSSPHALDCRFPRATLVKRIEQAHALRDSVLFVAAGDWKTTIRRVRRLGYGGQGLFVYLDPPFFRKANRLYRHYFSESKHKQLQQFVSKLRSPWILSYDPAPEIISLYTENGFRPESVELLYSTAGSNGVSRSQELVITNLPEMPKATRIWKTAKEWRFHRN